MQTFLFWLGCLLSLLLTLGSSAWAQAFTALPPRLAVYHSTNFDLAAMFTMPVVVPEHCALATRVSTQPPPRYDYRQARRVERKYLRAKRYYSRRNRRINQELRAERAKQLRFEQRQQRQNQKPVSRADLLLDPARCDCWQRRA